MGAPPLTIWGNVLICVRCGNGAAHRKRAKTMDKPENPYRKGTLIWSVMEGDWEDMAVSRIAETLCTTPQNISVYIWQIKNKTGYKVPHKIRKRGGDEQKKILVGSR